MAKQSGLHQIRGKVGEHSYYRQSGVSSGLIRSINQGLSSRVKTGDEYANTRLNNAEFGAACNVSGMLGRMVTPKYRPMILPFSQSIMAKKVLELAKGHPGLWGRRVVTADDTPELAQILSDTSKLKLSDYMTLDVSRSDSSTLDIEYTLTESQVSALLGFGIDGFVVKISAYIARTGQYSTATDRILRSSVRMEVTESINESLTPGEDINTNESLTIAPVIPLITNFVNHRFVTVVILPYKTVGDSSYTLQEYCMFQTYQIPDPS